MKLNRIFTLAALATTILFSVSCSDDEDYTPAEIPTGAQVFFPKGVATEIAPEADATSFSIPLNRANVAGNIDVSLSVSGTEGTIYNVPNSVNFKDGEATTALVVNYDPAGIEYGRYDTLTIAINNPELTTPYGASELTIVAGVTAWVDYGVAQYREDLMTTYFNVENLVYNVPIQKNIVKEGYYRLVNPYGAHYPYNEDGDYDADAVSYMVINATDPDWVYVEDCYTTMDWGYGAVTMLGYVYYYLINGNDLDVIKANRPDIFGTFKDGIITMPVNSMVISMADYNNGGFSYSNNNGLFAIVMPGYTMADYSVEVSYTGVFTDAGNNVFAVGNLTLGEDAKNVKAIVMNASDDAAAVADAIAAGDLEAVSVSAGRIEVPIAEGLTGKLQIVTVVLDGNNVKALATANFEYYGGSGVSPWKSLGIGMYVEDFVLPVFGNDPVYYGVEIEENTETPGLYRLVDAYAYIAEGFGVPGGHENIEVNAVDPEGVYILPQFIGLDLGWGDMSICTIGGYNVAIYGYDLVKAQRPDMLGTLEDGVITFPIFEADLNDGSTTLLQGYVEDNDGLMPGGMNGSVEIYLPSALQSNAKLKAKAETLKEAAKFERRLKAAKKVAKRRFFSKKFVKTAAEKLEMQTLK